MGVATLGGEGHVMTTTTMDQPDGTWSITTRVIVYSAIGAALYAVFNFISFGFATAGHQEVNVRPHYGLLTFFGFAFGPVVGFLTGLIGNIVGDFLSGYGAFTSWHWSLANGVAGLIAGLFGSGPPAGRPRPGSVRCGRPSPGCWRR